MVSLIIMNTSSIRIDLKHYNESNRASDLKSITLTIEFRGQSCIQARTKCRLQARSCGRNNYLNRHM